MVVSTVAESSRKGERSGDGEQGRIMTPARAADVAISEAVRLWGRGCIICRAQGRRSRVEHAWETCELNAESVEDVKKGLSFLGDVRAPFRTQGYRCWARGEGCRCRAEGRQGGCSGSEVIRSVVAALLFAGKVEVREWVEEQEAFAKSIEEDKDGRAALEELLSKKVMYGGERRAGLDAFIARWVT
jgi:hypothetical protein